MPRGLNGRATGRRKVAKHIAAAQAARGGAGSSSGGGRRAPAPIDGTIDTVLIDGFTICCQHASLQDRPPPTRRPPITVTFKPLAGAAAHAARMRPGSHAAAAAASSSAAGGGGAGGGGSGSGGNARGKRPRPPSPAGSDDERGGARGGGGSSALPMNGAAAHAGLGPSLAALTEPPTPPAAAAAPPREPRDRRPPPPREAASPPLPLQPRDDDRYDRYARKRGKSADGPPGPRARPPQGAYNFDDFVSDRPKPAAAPVPRGPPPREEPSETDAERFLVHVRETFALEPRKQQLFMEVMLNFSGGLLDTVEVMEHVSALFSGHLGLLLQFNRFLPDGYKIEALPPTLTDYRPCFTEYPFAPAKAEALSAAFFDRLQQRFADRQPTLQAIVRALESFTASEGTDTPPTRPQLARELAGLRAAVVPLLRGEPDLLKEIELYFPASTAPYGHTHTIVPTIKDLSASPPDPYLLMAPAQPPQPPQPPVPAKPLVPAKPAKPPAPPPGPLPLGNYGSSPALVNRPIVAKAVPPNPNPSANGHVATNGA